MTAAKGPDAVLRVMRWGMLAGTVLLLPALTCLFVLLKGKRLRSSDVGSFRWMT